MIKYAAVLTALAFSAPLISAAPLKRSSGILLSVIGNNNCLATNAGVGDGTGITAIPCDTVQTTDPTQAGYGLWDIVPGNQQGIMMTGTNFCLDAGDNPGSVAGLGAKIWTCYPGLPQQQWYYTQDLHIAVTNNNYCLTQGYYGTTYYGCGLSGGDIETQQFEVIGTQYASPTSTMATATATMTSPTTTATMTPPASGGQRIYWDGLCVTVDGASLSNGAILSVRDCFDDDDEFAQYQMWDIQEGPGPIKVHGTNFCIDYGLNPGNAVAAKIWECYDGAPQQNNYYTGSNHIALVDGSVCLDIRDNSGPNYNPPYGSVARIQQWQCSGTDPNQVFVL